MKPKYKTTLQIIGCVAASCLLLASCSKQERAERRVEKEIDETTKAVQQDIKSTIEVLKAEVDVAAAEAGNLPSQRFKADMAKADLTEIGKRLVAAAELEGEAAKKELKNGADGYDALIDSVKKAAEEAEGVEAEQLNAFAELLQTKKDAVIDAINSMP